MNHRTSIRRRVVVVAGGAALMTAAGIGGYLATSGGRSTVHFATAAAHVSTAGAAVDAANTVATAATTDPGPDVQQGPNVDVQSGAQSGAQDTTGVDTPEAATAAEADG